MSVVFYSFASLIIIPQCYFLIGNGANARTPLLAASSTVVNDHVSNRNRYRFPMQQQLSYYLDNFQDAGLTRFEGKAPSDLEDGQQRRGRGRRIHGESSSFNDASVLNSISGLSGFRVSSVFFLMIACVVIVFTLVSGLCWSLAGGPVVHSAHADKHPDILTHASSASARHNDSSAEHLQAPTHTLFHTRSNSASISAMGEDRTLLPPFNSSVGAADRHLSTHHHQHHQPHHHRHDDEDTYKPAVTWDFLDLIANDNANDSHREARSKHKYKDNDQHRVKHQYKLQHRDDDGSGWKAGVKWKSGDVDHAMWNRTRNHTGAGGSNGWDDEDADPLQPLDIEWHCRWRIIKASIQMLLPLHHHRHLSDRDNSDGDNDENGNNNDNNDDTDSNNSTSLHQYQDRDHFHISNTTIKMGIKKKRIDCSKYNDEWKRDDVNVTADEERHEQEESESMKMILRLIDKTLKLRWGRKIERRLKDIKGEFKAAYDRDHPTSKNNDSDDNNDDDDYNHEDNTSPVHALYAQNFTHPLSYGCAGDHCSDGNMFADNRLIAPILSAAATSHSSRHLKERKKTEKRHEIEKKKKKKGKKKEDSKDKKKQRDQDGRKHKGGDNHNNVLLAHTNHSSTSTNASLSLSCHQEGTCRPPPGAVTSLTDALIHAYVEEGNHDCAKWAGLFTPDTGLQVSPIRSCRLPYALGDQALRLYCELRAQTFGFQTIYSFIDRGKWQHENRCAPLYLHICISAYLHVCMPACLFVYICLYVHLCVCTYID